MTIKPSTEREIRLVKQAEDEMLLDFFVVLSASISEVDPATLVKIQKVIAAAELSKTVDPIEN